MRYKHMKKLFITALALPLLMADCGKDDLEEAHEHIAGGDGANTVVATSMSFTHNGSAYDTGMTLMDAEGTRFKIDRIRFYMGAFRFVNDLGDSVAAFPMKYHLVDIWEGGTVRNIGQLSGHLHDMTFGVGVDSVLNDTDPTLVDPPLGLNGMFWTWAEGYLFMTIDGRYDSPGDGDEVVGMNDPQLSYHCGMDTLFSWKTLEVHTDAHDGGNLILPLDLNVDTLMAGMDIAHDPVIHGVGPITIALMDKLSNAITHVE
jgi:hypothetical protein